MWCRRSKGFFQVIGKSFRRYPKNTYNWIRRPSRLGSANMPPEVNKKVGKNWQTSWHGNDHSLHAVLILSSLKDARLCLPAMAPSLKAMRSMRWPRLPDRHKLEESWKSASCQEPRNKSPQEFGKRLAESVRNVRIFVNEGLGHLGMSGYTFNTMISLMTVWCEAAPLHFNLSSRLVFETHGTEAARSPTAEAQPASCPTHTRQSSRNKLHPQ